MTRSEHVREHFRSAGRRPGHGYTRRNADEGTAYYAFDHGRVRCIMLDTVNPHGGWQGSLDAAQLGWLEAELTACADRPVRAVQPPSRWRRWSTTAAARRGPAHARPTSCATCCSATRAWSPGSTGTRTRTRSRAVRTDGAPGGFWQITTASHIDWPQQSRIDRAAGHRRRPGNLLHGTGHGGSGRVQGRSLADPAVLAALARELAANDWQVRDQIMADGGVGAGVVTDRNVVLPIDWPRPAPA